MELGIHGKRAFISGSSSGISGSSSGIGRGVAIELAKEGCDVVVHGRNVARTEEVAHEVAAYGVKAVVAIGNLATDEGCSEVAKRSLEAFGAIDIIVNNCGVALSKGNPLWSEMSPELWRESYEVNFMSSLRMSQLFLPGVIASSWGRFINISSIVSYLTPRFTEYGAAKAALNKLTADMAKDVGRFGATANGIAPGTIMTPSVEEWLTILSKRLGWTCTLREAEERYLNEVEPQPVREFGRVEDVGAIVAMLASPRASYITGVTIRMDGGSYRAVN